MRSRIGSYFSGLSTNKKPGVFQPKRPKDTGFRYARPIKEMIHEVADIKIQKTESVLEALILEANLIKKYQPKYNMIGKDDKSFSHFIITNEEFPRVLIVRETDLSPSSLIRSAKGRTTFSLSKEKGNVVVTTYGPYASKRQMEIALKIIRKIFPFHSLAAKTEKGCLDFQIGRCPGPYAQAISKKDYAKNIRGIRMILEGEKKGLVKKMEGEMKEYAKNNEFEKAAESRNKIFALKHLQDVALIGPEFSKSLITEKSLEKKLRVEAYDVSHISGQYATGSMAVFCGSEPDKSQYRKFKIKTVAGADDTGAMREILIRRFKNDWPRPDLILLDGGRGHLSIVQKLLSDLDLSIPVAAAAKGEKRKNTKIQNLKFKPNSQVRNILKDSNLIKKIMDEAHRFAVGYHRKLRKTDFLAE